MPEHNSNENLGMEMADKMADALFPQLKPRPVRPIPEKIEPTPSPWYVNKAGDICARIDGSEYVIAWVDCDSCLPEEEQIANGKLIAQAPILASIVRDLVAAWDKCDATGLHSLVLRSKLAISLSEVR